MLPAGQGAEGGWGRGPWRLKVTSRSSGTSSTGHALREREVETRKTVKLEILCVIQEKRSGSKGSPWRTAGSTTTLS